MTTEHDFKKALNAYESNTYDTPQEWVSCAGVIGDRELDETIRFALRLADKLLGQEPSEGMLDASFDAYWKSRSSKEVNEQANMSFTAMIEQAVKEIEND